MASWQAAQHLPIQPDRMYYEISLHWVFWYVGVPAVVLATIGAAVLARRCLRGQAPAWTLPLMSFAWIIVATLLRPSITPGSALGQPQARPRRAARLHPAGALGRQLAARLASPARRRPAAARRAWSRCSAAALIIPAVKTTFGLAASERRPASESAWSPPAWRTRSLSSGEIAAVDDLCAAIPAQLVGAASSASAYRDTGPGSPRHVRRTNGGRHQQ